MTPEQRQWWRIALELKLRKSSGDAFQGFFSAVMAGAYGSDFVRIRPFGSLGDKGCDGYRQSLGHVYQCYGALNGDSSKVAYLISKMAEDFAKAMSGVGTIMTKWFMVHNLVDGLPIEAILKLKELEANHKCNCAFMGIEAFEDIIFALDQGKIEELLGLAATTADALNMQAPELRDLIASLILAADEPATEIATISPVPPDKLEFNKLPNHWQFLIKSGWQNAHHVNNYLKQRHDPLTGERIAKLIHARYKYLKAQELSPGAIMGFLYEFVTGVGSVPPARQIAGQALLAFLFESCDIFEDRPIEIKS